jgi:cytohesin
LSKWEWGGKSIGPLIAAGAELEARDAHGWTPLHNAASGDIVEFVTALLDLGAGLHARDRRGFTPLHTAANEGSAACATVLLDRGAEIDARTAKAVDLTPAEEVDRTLECNPSDYRAYFAWRSGGKVEDGQTPLHRAAYWGHPAVADLLLDRGADPDAVDSRDQRPTDLAIARGHLELAGRLRARGAGRKS